uniref:Meiosis 1 arrest protein n=1 Tax=Ananas comosus var. bracteatus TaxID=296719 RepID=A0A6V7PSY1_ANACO|nr:unnamed protein product [Ananas comosus var. bracteatus]
MALLCFMLDLRNIPPPLLRDLKQPVFAAARESLRDVAGEREREGEARTVEILALRDRIGLCYIDRSRAPSSSAEVKIAYRPGERFSLRDFHHAVNSLPVDSFLPELRDSMHAKSDDRDVSLATLFSNKALYAWGSDEVSKKVIAICMSSCMKTEAIRKSLLDAAEQCVTVEFLLLDPEEENTLNDASKALCGFVNQLCDLENCVIRRYIPDSSVLNSLVKRWLEELKNDAEEPLQAVFLFKNASLGSSDRISCNLFASFCQIIDGFVSCQTCRCHGHPIDSRVADKMRKSCPLTFQELEASDLIDNAVKVGEQTILFLSSFEGDSDLRRVSAPITFNVMERTNLASLDEGVIVGTSYVVSPSSHDIEATLDEYDKSNLNTQLFYGLCGALYRLDQGLVCYSTCNMETMRDGSFLCYYILQPSDKGLMLLRRLAGSEEILPIPNVSKACDVTISEEIKNSIHSSLSKIELKDYNPLHHERGYHPKVNWLVRQSLQFGSVAPNCPEISLKSSNPESLKEEKKKTRSSVTDEWEKLLIVDDGMNDSYGETSSSSSKPKIPSLKISAQPKLLDEKTSRILERLEIPKPQKRKNSSPSVPINNVVSEETKKPLIPFEPSSSQPLKPNFQRLKKKLK